MSVEMPPIRVALVLGTSTGGVGQHVRSLVEQLPALGYHVTVLGPTATQQLFEFEQAGVTFVPIVMTASPNPRSDLATVRALRRQLANFDVVHAHGFRAAAFAGLALGRRKRGRVPLVATWHNAVLAAGIRRRVLAALERLAARRSDLTLGASSDLVERARELGATRAALAPVAALALPAPTRSRLQVREALGVGEANLIVAVGRLAPQKNYPMLLAAARVWRDSQPRPLVVVAGDGPLLAQMQAQIDAEHLPVRLLGRRDDVSDLFAAADVAVLTSHWEARALVAQEALRSGTPLVATAVGGVPELVGEAAILVDNDDAQTLARSVLNLLADPETRADYVRRGLDQAATWPDEAESARLVSDFYRSVLESAASGDLN